MSFIEPEIFFRRREARLGLLMRDRAGLVGCAIVSSKVEIEPDDMMVGRCSPHFGTTQAKFQGFRT